MEELGLGSVARFVTANLEYILLIVSMMMTRMLALRILAIASGLVGLVYAAQWLHDPVVLGWESVFVVVNVVQVALILRRNNAAPFSDDDQAFYQRVVSGLEPHQVRRLLKIGTWRDAQAGAELIRQGQIASDLIFLKSGRADVLLNGSRVGSCEPGSLVGEISISSGEPVMAAVVAATTARYLALERAGLVKVMDDDADIASAIELAKRRELKDKLMRMNERLLQKTP